MVLIDSEKEMKKNLELDIAKIEEDIGYYKDKIRKCELDLKVMYKYLRTEFKEDEQ